MRKKKCTETTMGVVTGIGIITAVKDKGLDYPTTVKVKYSVQGKEYIIQESLKLRSVPIKAGKMPIGQRKIPVLGKIELGKSLTVKYNPLKPQKAYIVGNDGIANV